MWLTEITYTEVATHVHKGCTHMYMYVSLQDVHTGVATATPMPHV